MWDVLIGFDYAGPELACYTPEGMTYLHRVSLNLRDEVKRRTAEGQWNGRPMLNHIHVGEGFTIYYAKDPIDTQNMTFGNVFGTLPGYPPASNYLSNPDAASRNIDLILTTIEEIVATDDDVYGSVVFRLGHVTHISDKTASQMANLVAKYPGLIEADVNIDSNLVTHAYVAPDSANISEYVSHLLSDRKSNFLLNDFPSAVAPDPHDVMRVGSVYGNFTVLKYLLQSGVPVMLPIILGTDGSGTEHALIDRQFTLSASLISYWSSIDPSFAALNVTSAYFTESVDIHLRVMDGEMKRGGGGSEWMIVWIVTGVFGGFVVSVLVVAVVLRRREMKQRDYESLSEEKAIVNE